MLIKSLKPLRVYLRRNTVELVPGQPIELTDDEGERLLSRVPDAVRQVSALPLTCATSGGCLQMDNPPKAEISSKPIDIMPTASGVVSQVSLPDGYCQECGGVYWIRQTPEAAYQCGRCAPVHPHVESVYVPGGTPPPSSRRSSAASPQDTVIEPAPSNARRIYWETGNGRILGPAVPEFLARDGESYWISTTFEGQIRWINADQLRSRKAFEEQAAVQEIELARF